MIIFQNPKRLHKKIKETKIADHKLKGSK